MKTVRWLLMLLVLASAASVPALAQWSVYFTDNSGNGMNGNGYYEDATFFQSTTTDGDQPGAATCHVTVTSENNFIGGNVWVPTVGAATQLSGGGDGTLLAVNTSGNIFRFIPITGQNPTVASTQSWVQLPGGLKQVAVGANANYVWGINSGGLIWHWNTSTLAWEAKPQPSGKLVNTVAISKHGDNQVWVTASDNTIYRWNYSTSNWTLMPAYASYVTTDGGDTFILGGTNKYGGNIWWWNGSGWTPWDNGILSTISVYNDAQTGRYLYGSRGGTLWQQFAGIPGGPNQWRAIGSGTYIEVGRAADVYASNNGTLSQYLPNVNATRTVYGTEGQSLTAIAEGFGDDFFSAPGSNIEIDGLGEAWDACLGAGAVVKKMSQKLMRVANTRVKYTNAYGAGSKPYTYDYNVKPWCSNYMPTTATNPPWNPLLVTDAQSYANTVVGWDTTGFCWRWTTSGAWSCVSHLPVANPEWPFNPVVVDAIAFFGPTFPYAECSPQPGT